MRRMELFEIQDHPLFLAFLRNLCTDALEALWSLSNSYKPILSRLHHALAEMQTLTFIYLGLRPASIRTSVATPAIQIRAIRAATVTSSRMLTPLLPGIWTLSRWTTAIAWKSIPEKGCTNAWRRQ